MITKSQAEKIQNKLSSQYGAYIYYNPLLDKIKVQKIEEEFEVHPSIKKFDNIKFIRVGFLRKVDSDVERNESNIDTFLSNQFIYIKIFYQLCV
jgi:hypothetical protein